MNMCLQIHMQPMCTHTDTMKQWIHH
uniref:Uncharacterized protein n=1 Tax=Rhizophora mucronata TaxID=61149 RepID=A0A2P2QG74_RHIMU